MSDGLRYALAVALILTGIVGASLGLYHVMLDAEFQLNGRFLQVSMVGLFGFLVLLILRYFSLLWFSYLNFLEDGPEEDQGFPLVSILVPAYNEGSVIQGSIRSLLALD
ncbi:MAG: hypothetical protein HKP27_02380, partial [Myxococcales bacterium]|nr:hypothetical protein [Myxococcales bacterium]